MADANYKVIVDVKVNGLKQLDGETESWWKKLGKTDKSLSSLRNSLLSVMFAGMAMSRLFGSQVNRVMELTGASELIKSFFTVALIQPIEDITLKLAELFAKFIALPDDVQKNAGWAMIGITGGGLAIMFLGGLANSIISITDLFSKFHTNLLSVAGKTYAITMGISGIMDLTEGKIMEGISNILISAGLFLPKTGKFAGLATGAIVIGAVLGITDTLISGDVTWGKLAVDAINMGLAGFYVGGWWGAGIGITAAFIINGLKINPEIWNSIEDFLQRVIAKFKVAFQHLPLIGHLSMFELTPSQRALYYKNQFETGSYNRYEEGGAGNINGYTSTMSFQDQIRGYTE